MCCVVTGTWQVGFGTECTYSKSCDGSEKIFKYWSSAVLLACIFCSILQVKKILLITFVKKWNIYLQERVCDQLFGRFFAESCRWFLQKFKWKNNIEKIIADMFLHGLSDFTVFKSNEGLLMQNGRQQYTLYFSFSFTKCAQRDVWTYYSCKEI